MLTNMSVEYWESLGCDEDRKLVCGTLNQTIVECSEGSTSKRIPSLSVGIVKSSQVWTGMVEGLEWRDSDVGESCSDPDYAGVEVEECAADSDGSSATENSILSEESAHSEESLSESDDEFVVFKSDTSVIENDSEYQLTPVDSLECLWMGDVEAANSDSDCPSESLLVDDAILEELQPRSLPFCSSVSPSPCRSRGECSTTEEPVFCVRKPWPCCPLTGRRSAVRKSSFHRACFSPSKQGKEPESPGRRKCVRFSPDADLITVHRMFAWDYASRAVRRGPWEEMARDRERFTEQVKRLEDKFRTVLSKEHRKAWQTAHILSRNKHE